MSNLNRHIKGDKIKWIATAIALLLISAALVGMCLQAFGKGKQKPSEWFPKSDCKHVEVVDKGMAATCTTAGMTDGKHCDVCGEIIVEQKVLPIIAHSYVDGVCSMCGKNSYTQYVITDDLGTGKRTKAFYNAADIFEVFKAANDGVGIIASVTNFENIFGGGYGGSGDGAWYIGNVMKFGATSANGSLTLNLNEPVDKVIITGYVADNYCKIQVGDSQSTDWTDSANDNKTATVTCSEMNVASKDGIASSIETSIAVEFASASSITIATTNKKPLYITSIEFCYVGDSRI